jgi:acyl CoA:acetate/3-ketoacid CoA transferase alpha subunit
MSPGSKIVAVRSERTHNHIEQRRRSAASTATTTSWKPVSFADLAIVHAWKGDAEGNLVYRMTARNFNPIISTAGKVTVAELEQLGKTGSPLALQSITTSQG